MDAAFGPPGDGINGIMEGPRRHSDRVRFFLVHHEEFKDKIQQLGH